MVNHPTPATATRKKNPLLRHVHTLRARRRRFEPARRPAGLFTFCPKQDPCPPENGKFAHLHFRNFRNFPPFAPLSSASASRCSHSLSLAARCYGYGCISGKLQVCELHWRLIRWRINSTTFLLHYNHLLFIGIILFTSFPPESNYIS